MSSNGAATEQDTRTLAGAIATLNTSGYRKVYEKMASVAAEGPSDENVQFMIAVENIEEVKRITFEKAVTKHYVERLITYVGEKIDSMQPQVFRDRSDFSSAEAFTGSYTPLYDSDCIDSDMFANFFLMPDDPCLFVIFTLGKAQQFADKFIFLQAKQFIY